MPISRREYLHQKGAIELLCEISTGGSQFEELLEAVSVSRPTLSTRLEQGRDVGLIDREAVTGDRGTTHTHVLTPKGATIRIRLFEVGVESSYKQYKNAWKYFDKKKDDFYTSLDEDLPYLDSEKENKENWITVSERESILPLDEEE